MAMFTNKTLRGVVEGYLSRTGYGRWEPRGALIDMDGTLYDSMRNHAEAWHRMMGELGVETDRKEFFMYEGRTGASTINILFRRAFGREATPEEIERHYHRKTVIFRELPDVEPMPGAADALSILSSRDIRRVLVTGSGQSSLINRLAEDYPGAFAAGDMITSRDVKHGKPNPEPYLMAMKLADVEPWQSLVLENAPLGVEAGAKSGALTIGLTTGPIPAEALREAGADVVFASMRECAINLPALLDVNISTDR